jgi:hypothetical protein
MEDQVSGFFQRCTIYAFPVHTDISMLIIDTKWDTMFSHGLLFQGASTVKIQLGVLV